MDPSTPARAGFSTANGTDYTREQGPTAMRLVALDLAHVSGTHYFWSVDVICASCLAVRLAKGITSCDGNRLLEVLWFLEKSRVD